MPKTVLGVRMEINKVLVHREMLQLGSERVSLPVIVPQLNNRMQQQKVD